MPSESKPVLGSTGRRSCWLGAAPRDDRLLRRYQELAEELSGLRPIPTEASTFERALQVQRRLALSGGLHHRSVKIADLIIAAAAEAADAPVLHYDADYDRIVEITGQAVQWIAARGSL